MKLFAAPMQGLTDAAWRKLHAEIYGPADAYFSPFLRVESGIVRQKDIRDITSPLNHGLNLIPQAIFRSVDELKIIAESVADAGYSCLDLNLGCPFSPQVRRGRGAALVSRPDIMEQVAALDLGLTLSVKMRPGVTDYEEWKSILPIINDMKLSHVTIHPRPAVLGYKGPICHECFAEMAAEIKHDIVYNGDITVPQQIDSYNNIYGVMIGRGLIARPSMIEEWRSGESWNINSRLDRLRQLLLDLMKHYSSTMCGDVQILKHLQPFTEYVDADFPPRTLKRIRKSQSLHAFEKALQELS